MHFEVIWRFSCSISIFSFLEINKKILVLMVLSFVNNNNSAFERALYLILASALSSSSRLPPRKQENQNRAGRRAVMPPGLQGAACTDDTPSAGTAHAHPGSTEEEEIITRMKSQCALHGWHLRGQIKISLTTASNAVTQHQIQAVCQINADPVVPEKGVWLTAVPWQREGPPVVHLQEPEVETEIDPFIIVSGVTQLINTLITNWMSSSLAIFLILLRGVAVSNYILHRDFPLCFCVHYI